MIFAYTNSTTNYLANAIQLMDNEYNDVKENQG